MNTDNYNQLMEELKTEYLQSFADKFQLLLDLHKNKDWEKIELEFHKLKGTGTTYGVPEVSELCFHLERLCSGGKRQSSGRSRPPWRKTATLGKDAAAVVRADRPRVPTSRQQLDRAGPTATKPERTSTASWSTNWLGPTRKHRNRRAASRATLLYQLRFRPAPIQLLNAHACLVVLGVKR